ALSGMTTPTPLPFAAPDEGAAEPGQERQQGELPARATAALQALAREHGLTLSAVLPGAWALLLSRYSGHDTVAFGTTVSGRTVDVPGVEAMAGLLINTLPLRVRVGPGDTGLDVFRRLHAVQAALARYAHTSPLDLHAWSGLPAHARLFESLVVIENYPRVEAGGGPLTVTDLRSGITSNYPLTLVLAPGGTLRLHLVYERRRFAREAMTGVLYAFQHVLERIAQDPGQPLAALLPAAVAEPTTPLPSVGPWRERGRAALRNGALGGAYTAPRDALERRLTALWEDVLDVRPVGVHDAFFDLGGQSLQALQLLNRVERAFGRKLPLALLLDGGNPARMAHALRGDGPVPAWATLVPLQPEGTRPPLYCVHSYDGQVLRYRHLARRLAPEQPVYGLQAVGIDGTAEPLTDVGAMAARYVAEVRSVQPEGPYVLLAICFGAAVALEMARLLVEQGHPVPHLFILDTAFQHLDPNRNGGGPPAPSNRLRRALAWSREGRLAEGVRNHLAWRGRHLKHAWVRATEGPQERRLRRISEANHTAWQRYRAAPYDGTVTFIRSSAWHEGHDKSWHAASWEGLARGGLTTHTLPGNHADMLDEPYVRALASRLRASLDPAAREAVLAPVNR
ncbi:MAG: condensation domain-containing protein, partial [Rhodothermales bacterium]|nr:condensation domain-containing protein [Rhodothermales bacterium]